MADHGHGHAHGHSEVGTATGVNYEDHLATYHAFLKATKYGVGVIIVLLAFLAWWFH
jgi:hypothetical protein